MDVRERGEDRVSNAEVLQALAARVRSEIYTAVPVKVTEDSDGHTASLQPLIKGVRRMPDGTSKTYDFPLIPKAPVNHASGGGMTDVIALADRRRRAALAQLREIENLVSVGAVRIVILCDDGCEESGPFHVAYRAAGLPDHLLITFHRKPTATLDDVLTWVRTHANAAQSALLYAQANGRLLNDTV